jgi:erythromycin esterase-like protein
MTQAVERNTSDTAAGLLRALEECALPWSGARSDLDPLLELAQGATVVLIGEATHGTHEFYRIRAELTERLIREQGFCAVAAEADWPDAYRVNRYVRGLGSDFDAEEALRDFRRFPTWMWRNADVLDFVGWLRQENEARPPQEKIGFYGLDLYSLGRSIEAVLRYLERQDPKAAERARARYGCFELFGDDPEHYAYGAGLGLEPNCEQAVVSQLVELRAEKERMLRRDGIVAEDEYFHAEQNARVVKNGEEYYRSMFRGHIATWNLRDTHMADTLDGLIEHLRRHNPQPKVVVWAHNSHVGDARATELGQKGEQTLGQLARERLNGRARLIGFSTFDGTVLAAPDWDRVPERRALRPALTDSYEHVFHRFARNFVLRTADLNERDPGAALHQPLLERAVGVVYRPQSERASHYFRAQLARQFDAVIHVDRTRALEPLERLRTEDETEVPETFPSGM